MINKLRKLYPALYHKALYFRQPILNVTFTVYSLMIAAVTALIILPYTTANTNKILLSIKNGDTALGIFYYPRIFSADDSWLKLGNFFFNNGATSKVTAEFVMLGDVIARVVFKLLGENILLTYKVISLICLTIWVYYFSKIISKNPSTHSAKNYSLIAITLVFLFGNSSSINPNYGFARLISPQFSITIWIIGIYIIYRYFELEVIKRNNVVYLIYLSILIYISSVTYLFTFLILSATSLVLMLFLTIQRKFNQLIVFIFCLIISLIPFCIHTLKNYNDPIFSMVLNRQGLFYSRLPGAAKTISLCIIGFGLIVLYKRYGKIKPNLDPFIVTILICTTGIMLASQSNLVSGRSIQFYHFETFAYILLLLAAIRLFNLIPFNIKPYTPRPKIIKILLIPTIFSLMLMQFYNTNVKPNNLSEIKQFFFKNFNDNDNLIIDLKNMQYSAPVYTRSKVLYQGDIIAYKFSDNEILKRYYVNSGCSNSVRLSEIPSLFEYQTQPMEQKGQQIRKYLEYIRLDKQLSQLYKPYFQEAQIKRLKIESLIKKFTENNQGLNCVQLAKYFGINYIVFDSYSFWNSLIAEEDIVRYQINDKVIAVTTVPK
jgi:hypothetical protein